MQRKLKVEKVTDVFIYIGWWANKLKQRTDLPAELLHCGGNYFSFSFVQLDLFWCAVISGTSNMAGMAGGGTDSAGRCAVNNCCGQKTVAAWNKSAWYVSAQRRGQIM